MTKVYLLAFAGLFQYVIVSGAIVLLSAGTLDYREAWVAMAIWFLSGLALTLYLIKYNPELLVRRTQIGAGSEKGTRQKLIVYTMSASYLAGAVVPGLDHRFGWSDVPQSWIIIGDVLMVLAFLIIFWVFRVNSYTSGNVQVDTDHKVVATGPYALVRHPMYVGFILLYGSASLALGSWWGLLAVLPWTLSLAWRLVDEEHFLIAHLPGYADYRSQVRYRLVPYVW
jgi:protein-S-isoprenylcysteine O-methyltransferase Ste14